MRLPQVLDIGRVRAFYAAGGTPGDLLAELEARTEAADPAIYIHRAPAEALAAAADALVARAPAANTLPLWGVPVAVKDNIDVAGMPTTAACPAFAYHAGEDASAVARLRAAGAIIVGKTNLDQFATGLNGTRSPCGVPRNLFDPGRVCGGSSSGSALAVAAGLVPIALGTDTAGSGRVPAAFNNIVGLKPSNGRIPTRGTVPACASLDAISIFAATVDDAATVRRLLEGMDEADPYSRPAALRLRPGRLRVGILRDADRVFGTTGYAGLYAAAVDATAASGAEILPFDPAPLLDVGAMLYGGAFVAERLAGLEAFLDAQPDAVEPTVRAILEGARAVTGAEAFRALDRLAALRRRVAASLAGNDVLLLPTVPELPTLSDIAAEPVAANLRLGRYTTFANLLGMACIAVPAGFTGAGLPFGVTLLAEADHDETLVPLAATLHAAARCGAGIDRRLEPPRVASAAEPPERIALVVAGAHLAGMPLNDELLRLDASFAGAARTAPDYRLYALAGGRPPRPGLVREPGFAGAGIEVEVWTMAPAAFGAFVAAVPAPLAIGKVALADGRTLPGFVAEPAALAGAVDVTRFGGWRAYLSAAA